MTKNNIMTRSGVRITSMTMDKGDTWVTVWDGRLYPDQEDERLREMSIRFESEELKKFIKKLKKHLPKKVKKIKEPNFTPWQPE